MRRLRHFRRQQLLDFPVGQRLGQTLPTSRQREVFRHVHRQQPFVFGEAVERPQRGDFEINALAAQAARRILRLVGQPASTLVLEEGHQMPKLNGLPIRQTLFARPSDELAQQPGVSLRRVVRLSALVAEVLQKIFDEILHWSWTFLSGERR